MTFRTSLVDFLTPAQSALGFAMLRHFGPPPSQHTFVQVIRNQRYRLGGAGIERHCPGCAEWKPFTLEFFTSRPRRWTGMDNLCRRCLSLYVTQRQTGRRFCDTCKAWFRRDSKQHRAECTCLCCQPVRPSLDGGDGVPTGAGMAGTVPVMRRDAHVPAGAV